MSTRKHESAFPLTTDTQVGHPGMTLRDWFAGQALIASIIQDNENDDPADAHATWAYTVADEMLKAREKEGKA